MSLGFGKWSHLEAILPPEMLTLVDENQVVKPLLAAVSFVAVLGGIYLWAVPNSITDPRRRKLPPGPKGLPLIGNMLDLADSDEVPNKVRKWHQDHGDIFYTKIGGSDFVWLSSPKVVKELMDKRSSIYSSRPALPMAQDVASGGQRQLFMSYGPRWRQLRKHTHALLNLNASIKYMPIQDFESKQVLRDLLDNPKEFYTINRRYSTSVIMLVTYGHRVPNFDDPLIKKIYTVLDNVTYITAFGAHVVDAFPSLASWPQWLFGNWRKKATKIFEHDSKIYLDLCNRLRREVDNGTARQCFCKDFYLNDPSKNGIDDLQAAYACAGMIEAGSETTATALNNWVLCMLLFPDTFKKVQEEVDRVVGKDRLPQWEDEPQLPYLRAMIKELMRYRPGNKFGMHHATSEDDWYDGMFIPKGSWAILNWWAIHHDPTIHPNPDVFDPSRYLDKPQTAAEYMNASDPYARDHFIFGAGRRACPGVHVAERSLFITIVRFVWGFNLTKAKGPDGRPIEPSTAMLPGWLSVPVPFDCDITPRSAGHEKIMREEFAKAEAAGI